MKQRPIVTMALLAAGGAGLWLLQREGATTEITPRPIFYLVADAQRQLERIPLRLTRVNVEEEGRVGRELASQISFAASEDDPSAQSRIAYLNELGGRLAVHAERRGINYRFHYIPHQGFVNAFALPGGQIFVGEGLLQLFETEDELAAVLGHEIAHVDRRHCIERFQYEIATRKLKLDLFYRLGPALLVRIFQQGYSKEQELDADRTGLRLAVEAGYSPAGALRVMEKFDELRNRTSQPKRSPVEELASLPLQSLQEYFRSHPPPQDRIAALEREIAVRGWDSSQETRPLPFQPGRGTQTEKAAEEKGFR